MQDMIGTEMDKFNSMMTKLKESVEDEPERQSISNVLNGCHMFQNVLRDNRLFDYKELIKGVLPSISEQPGGETPPESPSGEQPSEESPPESASNVSPIYSISRYIRL